VPIMKKSKVLVEMMIEKKREITKKVRRNTPFPQQFTLLSKYL
jgi:hypothetical protein